MNKYLPAAGWILAVSSIAFAGYQYRELKDIRGELDREILQGNLKAEIFDQDMNELEQTIADLRTRLNFARQDLALAREDLLEQQDSPQTDQFSNSDAPAMNGQRQIARMMNSPRIREIGSRMMLNSRYGQFISSLGLNAEDEEQLNEIMSDVISGQNELRILLANGEITLEEFQSSMADLNMEDALASFLTPSEMDAFYTYEAEEEARNRQQMESVMRMQLTAQTPGLTESNRELVAQTLVDVLGTSGRSGLASAGMVRAEVHAGPGDTEGASISLAAGGLNMQVEAYDSVLDQLEGTMDDDQFAIVENYVEQQQMQMEMVQEIMSMQGEEAEGGPRAFMITR